MKQYLINVEKVANPYSNHCSYMATFEGYDGAPIDFETPSSDPIGVADSPYEAIHNLLERALDKGLTE